MELKAPAMRNEQTLLAAPDAAFHMAGLTPLWDVARNMVLHEPKPVSAPYKWDYDALVRPAMMKAGETLLGADAERRVLLLSNPGLPSLGTTATLIAGMQLIKGGERADAHRHTQAALRIVVEGEGAMTSVDGERIAMSRGDVILTPSWSWHDHEKSGEGPMIWLDGLDVPLIGKLALTFSEEFPGGPVPRSRPDGFSNGLFGHGFAPLVAEAHAPLHARQLHFPYRDARNALWLLSQSSAPDPVEGYALGYTNGVAGGHIMPTIGASLRRLPSGFEGRRSRKTDATIFFVIEGAGSTLADDVSIEWKTNDVFVVPNWTWHSHHSKGGAVLFSFSDCALQQRIGLWREEREAADA